MDLSFASRMEAYYQKFFELQERLRKSEEERLKLEMKFNELVQMSREEEQAHYKKLRAQYKKFLEEDRKRQDRNEKIVRTLERIESRVNMLTSKTERLNMLRNQYQSYLNRVSAQRPVEKRNYFPPKIAEEPPRAEYKPLFDHDKKSDNITLLKKAYGKTNDEKIEILDKYLQSLKSQKEQVVSENKPRGIETDFNELKYFDEVSKKLNEGFNSNEANSVAEEIMNSIYTRHYKPDAFKEETKKASKFTCPNVTNYDEKDKYSGFGDSKDADNMRSKITSDMFNNKSKKDYSVIGSDINKVDASFSHLTGQISKGLPTFDEMKRSETNIGKEYPKSLQQGTDLFSNDSEHNITFQNQKPENFESFLSVLNEDEKTNDIPKIKDDVNENHRQIIHTIEADNYNSGDITPNQSGAKLIEEEEPVNHESQGKDTVQGVFCVNVIDEENKDIVNDDKLENGIHHQGHVDSVEINPPSLPGQENESNVPTENIEPIHRDSVEVNIKLEEEITESQAGELKSEQQKENQKTSHCDEPKKQTVDDELVQPQHETNNQLYEENIQSHAQNDQYDSNEQPVEQLYDANGKALEQYDESGQALYQQQSDHQTYDENGQNIQQYDEHCEPIQYQDDSQFNENVQYGENGQIIQHYGQPIQQYDANGQPIQYDENGQIVQQYDENGHIIQQYDENAQFYQDYDGQYDENGQPLQQYDANGQMIQNYDENGEGQQYDETGQPIFFNQNEGIVQYDENGQVIQFDENGQPVTQCDEPYQYETSEQPVDTNGSQLPNENLDSLQEYDNKQYQEAHELFDQDGNKNVFEQPQVVENDPAEVQHDNIDIKPAETENTKPLSKKNNVLDLLDTDSESIKQNTSKISNDSDFDFSNG